MIKTAGKSAFETQCIPTDPALLDVPDYKRFLEARRVSVSHRLNEFLEGAERPRP
jgi:hypothetical protein